MCQGETFPVHLLRGASCAMGSTKHVLVSLQKRPQLDEQLIVVGVSRFERLSRAKALGLGILACFRGLKIINVLKSIAH